MTYLVDKSSERGRDEVTYFSVGDLSCIHLGTKCSNFQEKKSMRKDVFLKISEFSAKVCTKKFPNRTLSIKQVIVVLY